MPSDSSTKHVSAACRRSPPAPWLPPGNNEFSTVARIIPGGLHNHSRTHLITILLGLLRTSLLRGIVALSTIVLKRWQVIFCVQLCFWFSNKHLHQCRWAPPSSFRPGRRSASPRPCSLESSCTCKDDRSWRCFSRNAGWDFVAFTFWLSWVSSCAEAHTPDHLE